MKEKAGFGIGLAAMLAVGAGAYLQTTSKPSSQRGTPTITSIPAHRHSHNQLGQLNSPYVDGCTAYLPPLTPVEEEKEKVAEDKDQPRDELRAEAYNVIETFVEQGQKRSVPQKTDVIKDELRQQISRNEDLSFMVAIAPDPRHTHLALTFDRTLEAIESAAEDEGYVYDSSWLPWTVEDRDYALRGDRTNEEAKADAREACPGVLLFRAGVSNVKPDPDAPYRKGLLVFIVGEQPTRGLKLSQWENTLHWMQTYSALGPYTDKAMASKPKPLLILGPAFSGTLPSLEQRLYALEPKQSSMAQPLIQPSGVFVASGMVSSCDSVEWYIRNAPSALQTRFVTFRENQALITQRLLHFLHSDIDHSQAAIISEDETAFGSLRSFEQPGACESAIEKEALHLYYPRDISNLRNAYQEEQLLGHATGMLSQGHDVVHTALSADLSAGIAEQSDSVPNYSKQSAMGEEAELYGIVSKLRSQHIKDVVLRCSNSLDSIFLTRFFHHTYPDARVIVVGADLLFRREVDTTEFRGTLTVSDYSLMPRSQDWTGKKDDVRLLTTHTFQSSDEEGVFLAARSLLVLNDDYFTYLTKTRNPASPYLDWKLHEDLPDFDRAGWLRENVPYLAGRSPDTWLTVIGRDGYWPLAALNSETVEDTSAVSTVAALLDHEPAAKTEMWDELNRVDIPWAMCALLSFGFACFHSLGCLNSNLLHFAGLDEVYKRRQGINEGWWRVLFGLTGASSLLPIWSLLLPWDCLHRLNADLSTSFVWRLGVLFCAVLWTVDVSSYLWLRKPGQALSFQGLSSAMTFVVVSLGVGLSLWWGLFTGLNNADAAPFFYRAVHLTGGVSPLLPIWVMLMGFHLWCVASLKGNGLLTLGKPILPAAASQSPETETGTLVRLRVVRTRISAAMTDKIEQAGQFLSYKQGQWIPASIFLIVCLLERCIQSDFPIRTFEQRPFGWLFNSLVLAALLLAITDATRMITMWLQLKRLLYSLARSPLRRTFRALRDISVRSLWDMSGNVPRSQYQLFWRQLEAAHSVKENSGLPVPAAVEKMERYGELFRKQYASNLEQSAPWSNYVPVLLPFPLEKPLHIRSVISECHAALSFWHLESKWESELPERTKQYLEAVKPGKDGDVPDLSLPLSNNPLTCAAEEFVCLAYISYIQNALARIRSLVFSMSTVFVAATLSIAAYPVNPKPEITMGMLMLLLLFAVAVAVVYAGMERDTILSDITNTQQVLSLEFYRKYFVFLVPPVLALLSAQFPELADTVFGWIQPDLAVVH